MKNHVEIEGNLGDDPKVVELKNDEKFLTVFSVAINEIFNKGKKDEKQVVDWVSVKCWNKLGRAASEKLKKADYVQVQGKLKTDSYDDKEGNKKVVTYLLASTVHKIESILSEKPEEKKKKKTAK